MKFYVIQHGELPWAMSAEFINYCKTWMIVDIVTLAPDWAFTLVRMMNPSLAGGMGWVLFGRG